MSATGREELAARLDAIQQGKCFICEKPIHRDYEKWHIDHIIPRAKGGKDEENNYALTHEHCNLNKLDADLRVARCMAKYEEIKSACGEEGPNRPNLGDFLKEFGGAKHSVRLKEESDAISISLSEARRPTVTLPMFVF